MHFNPGLPLDLDEKELGFVFGPGLFHPAPERRHLSAVRSSLLNPNAEGPEVLYAISMDIGEPADYPDLLKHNLLFGAVAYEAGTVGREPVRSQGHVHAISASCSSSTAELYEFWHGSGAVLMQERVDDDPGRCFAVVARPGDKVLVPPGWAHLTVNADPCSRMAFGAWCVRDYGFDYAEIRRRHGLAWYPIIDRHRLAWVANPAYAATGLTRKSPRSYAALGITSEPIYAQWQHHHSVFNFIAQPDLARTLWPDFVP